MQSEGKEALTAIVRRQAGSAVLDLYGELDGLGDEALGAAFDEAVSAEPERILLNFAGVDYINSTGIALIVGLLSQARRQALPLCACGLNEHYAELFRITRLADFMPVFDSEEAALQAAV
jgi:anti-anti-sigma factor